MNGKGKRSALKVLTVLTVCMILASCSTTKKNTKETESGWMKVQGIPADYMASDLSNGMEITGAVQPGGYTSTPVIDIESLKVIEGFSAPSASSVTLAQEERKDEIRKEAEEKGTKLVDSSLPEERYGENTSGTIAVDAETDSFRYLSSRTAYSNSIAEYDYTEGLIYEIITCPASVTDIRLQPGETLSGTPIMNNGTTQWQFTGGTSIEDGASVQHIFVRPLISGLDTTMILLTNMRTYYLRLASFETSHMVAVRWRYPSVTDNLSGSIQGITGTSQGFSVDLSRSDYGFSVSSSSKVKWTPTAVFSADGKTYIQFPASMKATDTMPAVYLRKNGNDSLVNFRISNDGLSYQIDAIPEEGQYILLKSGQKETVKIKKV